MLLVNEFEVYFKAWSFLEMNFMPTSEFGSGWTDQPNYWIEAFNIIGPEIKKYHDDLREEIRQKNGG